MTGTPRIVITGAAGFLGTRLVRALAPTAKVIAIDRRHPADPPPAREGSVEWHAIDLADREAVRETFDRIGSEGGADAVVHLAAYYDFTGEEHPEYRRTNVDALRLVLDAVARLGVRRFVFASSVAACAFSRPGRPIRESSPPDGSHVYARTKAAGEAMLREYADRVPSCAIRFAALYSDWCEYPPLYFFLETWLSDRWNARLLGGRGDSAIPFLHVRDAVEFVQRILRRADDLEPAEILLASPDGAISHAQLRAAAVGYAVGRASEPLHVPRVLCAPGMWARDQVGRILGSRPFERPWMAGYIDRRMDVDASRTRARLGWAPRERLEIRRRIPFMIENLRAQPVEWQRRNREALDHMRMPSDWLLGRVLEKHELSIDLAFAAVLEGRTRDRTLSSYAALDPEEREWSRRLTVRNLIHAVRTGSKAAFMDYCRNVAARRMRQGFPAHEIVAALRELDTICGEVLRTDPAAAGLAREVRETVSRTLEFGADQILDVYEEEGR